MRVRSWRWSVRSLRRRMGTAPVYNPVVSAQLDALNSSDQAQQSVIKNAATNPALTQATHGYFKNVE